MEHSKWRHGNLQCTHCGQLQFHSEQLWNVCLKMDDHEWHLYTEFSSSHSELLPDANHCNRGSDTKSLRHINQRITGWQHTSSRYRGMEHSKRRHGILQFTDFRQLNLYSEYIHILHITLDDHEWNLFFKFSRYNR